MLKVNDKAPDFKLKDSDGKEHKLSDFKGKKVVVYFYPKDNTPGCTQEACDFRDNFARIKKKAVLIGISKDSEKSHKGFADKYDLPFILLSDPSGETIEKYGAFKEKSMFGKTFLGIQRSTFIVDETGKIKKVFPDVSVKGHVDEVMKEL